MDWTTFSAIAKVLALIAAGIWVVIKYLSFQHEQAMLANRLQRLEAEHRGQPRLESGLKVRVDSDEEIGNGVHRYVLVVELSIKNLSKKAVEVTATTIDYSLGNLTPIASESKCVFAWNPPPGAMDEEILNAAIADYPVLWEKLGDQSAVSRYRGRNALELPLLSHLNMRRFSLGGWATGPLREEEKSYINFDLQLTAIPQQWIGVATAFFLDECSGMGDLRYERFWSELRILSKRSINEQQIQ